MRVHIDKSHTLISGTVAELNAVNERISVFLDSGECCLYLPAETSGTARESGASLLGIELVKSEGPIMVSSEVEVGLRLAGSIENLRVWCSNFGFPGDAVDGNHHHPEYDLYAQGGMAPGSLPVTIEVRDVED
jgi:hypothetical protein